MSTEGELRVGRHFTVPPDELRWRFSASGGPGGQHVNTANTRVELVFDIARSAALGPRQRARLVERLGPVARVVVSTERSQARNRALALQRLALRLEEGLRRDPPRLATAPTRASRRRRLQDKQHRAQRKQERRRPDLDHG
jgi:ribosome-associated protein